MKNILGLLLMMCTVLFWMGCSCTTTFTDARDGEVYGQVTIGNQTWMAENLRYIATGSWLILLILLQLMDACMIGLR